MHTHRLLKLYGKGRSGNNSQHFLVNYTHLETYNERSVPIPKLKNAYRVRRMVLNL
jgi:hypothetical protein